MFFKKKNIFASYDTEIVTKRNTTLVVTLVCSCPSDIKEKIFWKACEELKKYSGVTCPKTITVDGIEVRIPYVDEYLTLTSGPWTLLEANSMTTQTMYLNIRVKFEDIKGVTIDILKTKLDRFVMTELNTQVFNSNDTGYYEYYETDENSPIDTLDIEVSKIITRRDKLEA